MRWVLKLSVSRVLGTIAVGLVWLATSASGEDSLQGWSELRPESRRSLLLDVAAVDVGGRRLIAVGERGHVLVSSDGGAEFAQVTVPTQAMLTAVAVHPPHVWVVGHDATIIHSPDAGAHWELQYAAPEDESPLLDVWFETATRGLAVGAYGLALETADGGASWQACQIAGDREPHLYSIAYDAAADRLYIAGEFGFVARSDDRGVTFATSSGDAAALTSPYTGTLFGVHVPSSGSVLVYGLRGHLYRSTDGGDTWQAVPTGVEASLLAAANGAAGEVWVAGLAGTLLRSRDGGTTFANLSRDDRRGIAGIWLQPDALLVTGESGVRRLALADLAGGGRR